MRFDLSAAVPTIAVSTYSTHFHSSSERMPTYAALYRHHEQPTMSDPAFLGEENFTLRLEDFRQRFGPAQSSKKCRRRSGGVLRSGQAFLFQSGRHRRPRRNPAAESVYPRDGRDVLREGSM